MSILSTNDINIAMGRRLMAVRSMCGLTQFEFADQLGISPRAYANYERGEREMPATMFKRLRDTFSIDPVWLMEGPGEAPVRVRDRLVDMELLEEIVRMIHEWQRKHRATLKPDKLARVIRLGYETCVDHGSLDKGRLQEMLSLAA